jgi:hypothetical protein
MSFYGHFGYIKITKGFMIKIISLTGLHVYQYTLFVVTSGIGGLHTIGGYNERYLFPIWVTV